MLNSWKSFSSNTTIDYDINVERGQSFNSIYIDVVLPQQPPLLYKAYLSQVLKVPQNLKFGYYKGNNESLEQFYFRITTGIVSQVSLKILEGHSTYDIADQLETIDLIEQKRFLEAVTDKELIQKLTGLSIDTMEGYLYPDTYSLDYDTEPSVLISRLYGNYLKKLPEDFSNKAKSVGLTEHQAVILASIIQKETYQVDEMPIISSVYHNRMNINMRLQADPTVIYGLMPGFDGNLKRADLRNKQNRYNTYIHYGLPPTPIANPSSSALSAAVSPAQTDYIFFVANGKGGHNFSITYEEHKEYVDQYLKLLNE